MFEIAERIGSDAKNLRVHQAHALRGREFGIVPPPPPERIATLEFADDDPNTLTTKSAGFQWGKSPKAYEDHGLSGPCDRRYV